MRPQSAGRAEIFWAWRLAATRSLPMRRKSFWRAASLAKLARRADILYRPSRGVLADDFPKKSFGRRFIRARVDGAKIFLPERHESGALYSAIGCNAFVDIPAGSDALKAGAFGENLLTDAFDFKSLPLGTPIDVFFEVTQIGKEQPLRDLSAGRRLYHAARRYLCPHPARRKNFGRRRIETCRKKNSARRGDNHGQRAAAFMGCAPRTQAATNARNS